MKYLWPVAFKVVLGSVAIAYCISAVVPDASAVDAPHWGVNDPALVDWGVAFGCDGCHVGHHSAGGGLTVAAGNRNLCQTCHNSTIGALAADLPIENWAEASPGTEGLHHAFEKLATNPAYGAQEPQHQEMLLRIMEGNVVCSTCHNQHDSGQIAGGKPRVGIPKKVENNGGSGVLTASGTFSGPEGVWYLIRVTQADSQFEYSKDEGLSWIGPININPTVGLDSGVSVHFGAGTFALNERWRFSAAFPYLRVPIDEGDNTIGDKFCRDCHRDWVMETADVRNWNSGSTKSHPVGISIPSAEGYHNGIPRDGNGAEQGGGGADSNVSNDYRLDGESRLQCISCHGVHYADSNTLTEDGP